MFNNALQFLLDVFLQGYAALLLIRFLLQWLRVSMRNPVGDALMALTNVIVLPTRRYFPATGQLDTATVLLAMLIEMIYLGFLLALQGYPYESFPLPGLIVWAGVKQLITSVYFLMAALITQAILSWVNPHTPIAPLLNGITHRFLSPIRRVVPLLGNVDLAPFILLVICQLILIAPLAMLESMALRLF